MVSFKTVRTRKLLLSKPKPRFLGEWISCQMAQDLLRRLFCGWSRPEPLLLSKAWFLRKKTLPGSHIWRIDWKTWLTWNLSPEAQKWSLAYQPQHGKQYRKHGSCCVYSRREQIMCFWELLDLFKSFGSYRSQNVTAPVNGVSKDGCSCGWSQSQKWQHVQILQRFRAGL